jgi:cytochrome c556
MDKAVHDAAVEVAEAAAEHNLQRVLHNVESLQRGCVACHTAYRDTVRSALYQTTSR